ncbi:MAG: hypothetical protein QM756_45985 [Polyangiaceae bacterium]
MKITSLVASSAVAFLFALTTVRPAHAGLAACNNINVEASSTCEVTPPSVDCTAACTPITFEAACSAELEVSCDGECTVNASATCTGSCDATCEASCTGTPATFDCKADCSLRAQASCEGNCTSAANKTQCKAACKATASADCDAECKVTPPTATCMAKCQASCKGSCHAEANAKCQVDCQTKGYATCEAKLQGHCDVDCKSTGSGALYCDGQYIDHGGNLDECIKSINAVVTVDVKGSSSCSGNTCQAEGSAEASCTVARVLGSGAGANGGYVALLAGIVGLAARRRRNKR